MSYYLPANWKILDVIGGCLVHSKIFCFHSFSCAVASVFWIFFTYAYLVTNVLLLSLHLHLTPYSSSISKLDEYTFYRDCVKYSKKRPRIWNECCALDSIRTQAQQTRGQKKMWKIEDGCCEAKTMISHMKRINPNKYTRCLFFACKLLRRRWK